MWNAPPQQLPQRYLSKVKRITCRVWDINRAIQANSNDVTTQWCQFRLGPQPIHTAIDLVHTHCDNPKRSFHLTVEPNGCLHSPNLSSFRNLQPIKLITYQQKTGRQMLLTALEMLLDPRKGADFSFHKGKFQDLESTPFFLSTPSLHKVAQQLGADLILGTLAHFRIPVEQLPEAWASFSIPNLI
jgi:hypothetical protein